MSKNSLSAQESETLLALLKTRFDNNINRHKDIEWSNIEAKLKSDSGKLWSLNEMERSGGEPDVIGYNKETDEYLFCDCATETPKGRRSICYDRAALDSRKEFKPENTALDLANEMGIEILDEAQFRYLQQFGQFDTKTSSWIKTPAEIRKLGGALFCDYRFGTVFVYHNGAESYYGARAFRGLLKV